MSKNEKQGMKKSTKAIIAAVVAVVLVAAVLVGIFVVKPAIDKEKNPSTEPSFEVEQNGNETFEYVKYKGVRMAKELAQILTKAEEDSKAAAKKYGTAFEIGDIKISKSELCMYYQDQHSMKLREVEYSIQTKGQNFTGYEVDKLPTDQKYPGEDYTWADKFVSECISDAKNLYATFDLALESGLTLTENEINNLINAYTRVERVVSGDQTPDDLVVSVYGEGATYAMFAKREIMQTYAVKYEETTAKAYYDELSESEVKAERDKDPDLYASMNVRVYPIQADYDPVEISSVSNEQEFLDFAKKNYPEDGYNAEVLTQTYHVTKQKLSATFGEEVGEWAFADDRVEGEIALITGQLYQYLVYIDSLPVYEHSHNVVIYNRPFEGKETAEDLEKIYNDNKTLFNEMKDSNATAIDFMNRMSNTGYNCYEATVRSGEYYYEVNNWILDGERKSGDIAMFADSENGIYIVYYVGSNPDDYDWEHYIRTGISDEKYMEEYEAFVEDYKIKENKSIIDKVISETNTVIKNKMNSNS